MGETFGIGEHMVDWDEGIQENVWLGDYSVKFKINKERELQTDLEYCKLS